MAPGTDPNGQIKPRKSVEIRPLCGIHPFGRHFQPAPDPLYYFIIPETRIRFWHYRSPGNMWLAGTSWVAFWVTFIGFSSVLYVTLDDGIPMLPARLLFFIIFGLEAILVGIFETLRFKNLTGIGKKPLPQVKLTSAPTKIAIKPKPMDDLKPEDFNFKDKEEGWEK